MCFLWKKLVFASRASFSMSEYLVPVFNDLIAQLSNAYSE
jgi:hypothetical protein